MFDMIYMWSSQSDIHLSLDKHVQSLSPMKSYMKTAMAEVAEGMDNSKNILFCQVPAVPVLTLTPCGRGVEFQ